MTATNAEYRESEDDFGLFCSEVLNTSDPDAITPAGDVFTRYCDWATRYRMNPMHLTAFGRRMAARFTKLRTKSGIIYQGVKF